MLSEMTGISPHQIRKDLSYFGEFGKRGIGYPISELLVTLKEILKSNKKWDIVLVGAGNIGTAFLRYKGFSKRGFMIKAVFDNDIYKVGKKIGNIKIRAIKEMENYLRIKNIKIGIIAVPSESAQEVADKMIAGGGRAILNFAPVSIKHPREVIIKQIDIAIELEKLVFYLS
jgi:redox-sensing transcriptional repressor